MKKKMAEELLQKVAGSLCEGRFLARGNLLFERPVGAVLKGLWLDSSGFDAKAFNPSVFIQPMFRKSSSLVLSFGQRFPGNWSSDDEHVAKRLIEHTKTVGSEFWGRYGSTEKLAALTLDPRDPLRAITTGYALVLIHRFDEAKQALLSASERLKQIYEKQMGAEPSFWANDLDSEVKTFIEELQRAPDAAIKVLKDWQAFTVNSLQLTQWSDHSM